MRLENSKQGTALNDTQGRYIDKLFSSYKPLTPFYGWHLAGDGERGDRCGDTIWSACPSRQEGHSKRSITLNCHDMTCPECYEDEAWKLAGEEDDRINQVERAYHREGVDLERCHIVMSPPKEIYKIMETKEGLQLFKKELRRLLKQAGIVGGVVMIHQYRGSKKVMDRIRKGADAEESWHVHVDGLSVQRYIGGALNPVIVKSSDMYQATGWIYKYMGFLAKRWRTTRERIAYELGHAAIYELEPEEYVTGEGAREELHQRHHKGHIATWYGILSYNNVVREEHVEEEPELCEKCKKQMNIYREENCDPDMFIKESVIRRVTYQYTLDLERLEKLLLKHRLRRVRQPVRHTCQASIAPIEPIAHGP